MRDLNPNFLVPWLRLKYWINLSFLELTPFSCTHKCKWKFTYKCVKWPAHSSPNMCLLYAFDGLAPGPLNAFSLQNYIFWVLFTTQGKENCLKTRGVSKQNTQKLLEGLRSRSRNWTWLSSLVYTDQISSWWCHLAFIPGFKKIKIPLKQKMSVLLLILQNIHLMYPVVKGLPIPLSLSPNVWEQQHTQYQCQIT